MKKEFKMSQSRFDVAGRVTAGSSGHRWAPPVQDPAWGPSSGGTASGWAAASVSSLGMLSVYLWRQSMHSYWRIPSH